MFTVGGKFIGKKGYFFHTAEGFRIGGLGVGRRLFGSRRIGGGNIQHKLSIHCSFLRIEVGI